MLSDNVIVVLVLIVTYTSDIGLKLFYKMSSREAFNS